MSRELATEERRGLWSLHEVEAAPADETGSRHHIGNGKQHLDSARPQGFGDGEETPKVTEMAAKLPCEDNSLHV